ncbi:MAG: universal stress protein [Anaerolineae bacterium]|jgi:nucleotide-binding universal stress UspA family protein
MSSRRSANFYAALQDFRAARRDAALEQIIERLRGKSVDLFSYEDVRHKLRARERSGQKLKEIPIAAIIGSVSRYTDFTRSFLPRDSVSEERWSQVRAAMTDMSGLPPIEVYQIGDAYFVVDGNHRVSAARQLNANYIEAYVTELETPVHLSPGDQPEDLVIKAEYADFLERTGLHTLRPDAQLIVSEPGQYHTLEEHIQVHRHYMGLEQQREISPEEAAAHWYDHVYGPVVRTISRQGILREFPGRTETDLYIWLAEHRSAVESALEMDVRPEAAAVDLAEQQGTRVGSAVRRLFDRIRRALTPDEFEGGPPPGRWRRIYLGARQEQAQPPSAVEAAVPREEEQLFADLLVPLSGEQAAWHALEQALVVARREGSRIYGLHVVPTQTQKQGPEAEAVGDEFDRRCRDAGVPARFTLSVGEVPDQICRRARWVDLVVINLAFPPAPRPLARLNSGFRSVLVRCPRPVLVVPQVTRPLDRLLLAYDDSPKAQEALFIAAYLAGRWRMPLWVLTVLDGRRVTGETQRRARRYLEDRRVPATFLRESGAPAQAILDVAERERADLILMGGYGTGPVLEAVLGSTVDQVLRQCPRPLLICR